MNTCYGVVCDELGHARSGGQVWATPSSDVRRVQASQIAIDQDHDGRWVGEIVYLERRHGLLWAVGRVSNDVLPEVRVRVGSELRGVPHELYWSATRIGDADTGIDITSVALTAWPAQVSARPLTFRQGDVHMAAWQSTDSFERELLHRANEYDTKRHGGPIVIQGDSATSPIAKTPVLEPAFGLIEYRSASFNVTTGRRQIVALVAPYEHDASVVINGRRCREQFAAGAFDGVATQTNAIRLNMNHRPEDVVGKAVEFATGRSDGLVATFKVSRTRLGDEALELASEDCVDCSVGFAVVRESWPQSDLRRVHEGWLDHVALVAAPAYSSAKVLGVRGDELELAGVR